MTVANGLVIDPAQGRASRHHQPINIASFLDQLTRSFRPIEPETRSPLQSTFTLGSEPGTRVTGVRQTSGISLNTLYTPLVNPDSEQGTSDPFPLIVEISPTSHFSLFRKK